MKKLPPLPEHVLDELADWLVLQHSGEMTDTQRQAFEQWKVNHLVHHHSMDQIEKFTSTLSALPETLHSETLVKSEHQLNIKINQYQLLLSISVFILIGSLIYILPWSKWQADQSTTVGEIKSLTLDDGSQLILASDSSVNINFNQRTREIQLIQGEIYIKTAKDYQQHRPFFVKTQYGQIEALGTQFIIKQDQNEKTKVKVYEHAVAIYPKDKHSRTVLQQGHKIAFNDQVLSNTYAIKQQKPYWTQQLLVVENWSLKKVMHELYRYRQGIYFIDPALDKIQVSGVFSLKNTTQSIETLAQTYSLQLNYYGNHILSIKQK